MKRVIKPPKEIILDFDALMILFMEISLEDSITDIIMDTVFCHFTSFVE